jgi:hypothetical protein
MKDFKNVLVFAALSAMLTADILRINHFLPLDIHKYIFAQKHIADDSKSSSGAGSRPALRLKRRELTEA